MKAIVLFGHGSRDPLWHQPIQSVAARIAELSPHTLVRCAYLELTEPDLPSAAADLIAAGVTHLKQITANKLNAQKSTVQERKREKLGQGVMRLSMDCDPWMLLPLVKIHLNLNSSISKC